MYDVNSEATYTNVRNWMESVQVCSDLTYVQIYHSNKWMGGNVQVEGQGTFAIDKRALKKLPLVVWLTFDHSFYWQDYHLTVTAKCLECVDVTKFSS